MTGKIKVCCDRRNWTPKPTSGSCLPPALTLVSRCPTSVLAFDTLPWNASSVSVLICNQIISVILRLHTSRSPAFASALWSCFVNITQQLMPLMNIVCIMLQFSQRRSFDSQCCALMRYQHSVSVPGATVTQEPSGIPEVLPGQWVSVGPPLSGTCITREAFL